MATDSRPRYWDGTGWVREEKAELPSGLKLDELPAFAAGWGIPGNAEFKIQDVYEDREIILSWMVPAEEEGQ